MSNRQRQSGKKRFRSDGSSIWSRRNIDGPGIWISCIRDKERQAIGESYDLFESLAEELWPTSQDLDADNDAEDAEEEDIEKAVLKEVEKMKKPRKQKLFSSVQTGTPCLIFMSCKPPIDPVVLVEVYMKKVEETGITQTRAAQRFVPVTNSCDANLAEIVSLCKRIALPVFEKEAKAYRYRIEIRTRNHKTVNRDEIIKMIAECIPKTHTVDLENPELFILVEVFKATCGMSVVRDYYRYKKFNAVEVSQASLTKAEEGAQ